MNPRWLMDTHIWIWYGMRNPRLGVAGRELIEDSVRKGGLAVSIMTLWEISLLESKRRIHLGTSAAKWLDDALALPNLKVLPLELPVILDAHRLPGSFHPDPVDRLIVATARHYNLTLITDDRKLLDYAEQGYLRAHASGDEALLSA